MKRFLQLVCWLLVGVVGVQGQQTVYWRDNAVNGNWENGDCAAIGTSPSQWWYPGFSPNQARNRPDCNDGSTTRHNVIIDNNNETTMTVNTTFWGLRSLTFANTATSNRTINSNPDDNTRGIGLTDGIYNNGNSGVTHTFNTRIGIDASSIIIRTTYAGATSTYNREIFGNANNITFDGAGETNVATVISGTGASVTKNDAGTLTFSGATANTYTGATTINAGLLVLNKNSGTIAIPGPLTVAAGATVRTDAANQWGTGTPPLVTLNGNAILNLNNTNQKIALASASNTSSVLLGSAILTIHNTATDTYAGAISGTGGLTKEGSSTLTLSGSNTYTGATTINAGDLIYNSATALPNGSNVTLAGGRMVMANTIPAVNFTPGTLTLGGTTNSEIVLGASANAVTITFANSSAISWTAGRRLTIRNWSPTGNKNIFFAGQGLTTAQLDVIDFDGYGLGAKFDGATNRIIPRFIYVTQASGSGNFSAASSWLNNDNPTSTSCASNPATIVIQSGFTLTQDIPYDLTRIENSGTYLSNNVTITLCAGGSIINNGIIDFTTAGGGTLVCTGAATFSGTAPSANFGLNNLTLNGTTTLTTAPTIRGTLQLNAGGTVSAPPVYTNTSTLVYNQGTTITMGFEWDTGNASSIGLGLPQNVTIQNNTILDQPGSNRGCAGNLLISSGNLRLSTTNGVDLYVGGNFTNNGTFTHNNRALFMVGSGAQTLNGTLNGTGATNCFPFLLINKSAGTVTLNTPVNVTNTITLTNGTITLGSNNLHITSGTAIAGAPFSTTKMIIADGSGQLLFTTATNTSYLFPIGDNTSGADYSPITITLTAGAAAGNTIGMRVVDAAVPNTPLNTPTAPTDYITRYWVPSSSGFTNISWNGTATYAASSDEEGTAANLRFSVWHPAPENSWMDYGGPPSGQTLTGGTNITDLNALSGSAFITGRQAAPKLYYRSNATTMNWSNAADWQTSPVADFSSGLATALVPPSATNSSGITIRNGHTVTINAAATLDQAIVENGAILIKENGDLTVNNGSGIDLEIQNGGIFRHATTSGNFPSFASGSEVWVRTGGTIEATQATGGPSKYATELNMHYETNAVFDYKTNNPFLTNGVTYFLNAGPTVIPIFRLSVNLSLAVGANNNTTINGLFEANGNLTWQNGGTKTFRNGIIGSGNVTQDANCGAFIISGTSSILGGSGTISLNTAGLQITDGTCTMQSSKPIAGTGTFTVNNGATLNAGTHALSGSAPFTLAAGGTLISASPTGVNGNITTSGTKTFTAGANYTFNGITAQTTGNLMGTTIGTLTINNPTTVTLTNNNHVASTLNLQAGIFRCGTGQTLFMPNGAVINGTGGNQDNNPEAGTIHLLGGATVNATLAGQPNLYQVIVGNGVVNTGVNFRGSGPSNATILNTLTINSQGFLTEAPFYAVNSTLVYNSGGTYNKLVEMGQATPGQPGYPWHVTVQNNTTLNLLPGNVLSNQGMSGNLTLGLDGAGNGTLEANNITMDIVVGGNLIIGGATATGIFNMSSAFGADLFLTGNYIRSANGIFNPNNRAVFLTGATNASINAPGPGPEIFPFLIVDKTNGMNNTVDLNAPVEVTQRLSLTSGRINTTYANILTISNTTPDNADNGIVYNDSNPAYIDGPLRRQVNNVTGNNSYVFPVGRFDGTTHFAKRIRMKELTNGAGSFTVTYERGYPPGNPGPQYFFQDILKGIRDSEYWNVERTTGSTEGRIVLPYTYIPGNTWFWEDGSKITPNPIARVAVVRGSGTNSANWNFTQPLVSNFTTEDVNPAEHEARLVTSDGDIISRHIDAFSPFTFGWGLNQVLILPLKLLGFTAKAVGPDVLLQWQYADAKDLAYTTIEYSTDGQRFGPLQRVAGTTALHYSYRHQQPGNGIHYYRLLMADKNGETTYSAVQVVQIGVNQSYITGLLQNPVQGTQAVVQGYSATAQTARVLLSDVQGRRLLAASYRVAQGSFSLPVSLLPVAKGNYYLQLLLNDGTSKTMKVVY